MSNPNHSSGQSLFTLPLDLIEQVERGNVLLFVGERLSAGLAGTRIEDALAEAFATRLELGAAHGLNFAELAQVYEDTRGRAALVDLVVRHVQAHGNTPLPAHHLIAALSQCSVIITTDLGEGIERAFADAERPLQVVVRNEDVVFEDEGVTQLYRLRGTLARRESLILTEDDYERFFLAPDNLSRVLEGYLARKTILFLGYDLDDPYFKQLYTKIAGSLDRFQRRAYAFGATPPPAVANWCRRRGIELVTIEAAVVLQAISDQLAARRLPAMPRTSPSSALDTPLPSQPYKQLDYYEADDAAIYVGREPEVLELSARIRAHRLTLLYGASGVGKTSLLLAGALPRLAAQDPPLTALYVRALDDPALVIRRALARRLPGVALPSEGSLLDTVAAAIQALGTPLIIVLDQFEEFFIRLSPQFRAAFIAELGSLCDARDLPLKLVLSLREDWLAAVNELERRIPEVFRNRLRILPLTPAQAQLAITVPVERLRRRYEPALVAQLLADLGGGSAEIMPPQLQLVCSALYRRLAPDEQTITLATYAALGGARGVLQQYLADELARLGRDERTLARGLLAELVTSQGTKAVRSTAELALALELEASALSPTLDRLVGARLLRALEREDGTLAYELAHEYLIHEIELAPEAQQRKQAEELLRQEVDNWQRFGTLLAADKLALVSDVRDQLRLDPAAQELLLRSALEVDNEVAYWLERLHNPAQRATILAEKAGTRVAAVRQRVATALASQDVVATLEPLLALALRDPDAQVRATAQAGLLCLVDQRPALINALAAATERRDERTAALQSLGLFPLSDVPGGLRGAVLRARAQARLQGIARASTATVGRRVALITSSGVLAVLLGLVLVGWNTYYLDVQLQERESLLVVRRGLPFLPALSRTAVDLQTPTYYLASDTAQPIFERQVWGFWLLRGQRDYAKWAKDLAVRLDLAIGLPLLWYLDQSEGEKWLTEAATAADPGSRGWAAETFADLLIRDPQQPLEPLLALLADPDPSVRARTADTLVRLHLAPEAPVPTLTSALLPLLDDPDPAARSSAGAALAALAAHPMADPNTIMAALVSLQNDPDPNVRQRLAQNLALTSQNPQADPQALTELLLDLFADKDETLQGYAAESLGALATRSDAPLDTIIPPLLAKLTTTGEQLPAERLLRERVSAALLQASTNPAAPLEELVATALPLISDEQFNRSDAEDGPLAVLAQHPKLSMDILVKALRSRLFKPDGQANWAVFSLLRERLEREPVTPQSEQLSAALNLAQYGSSEARQAAAAILDLSIEPPVANLQQLLTALTPLLTHEEQAIRYEALRLLERSAPLTPDLELAQLLTVLEPALVEYVRTPTMMRYPVAKVLETWLIANPQADLVALANTLRPLLLHDDLGLHSTTYMLLRDQAKSYPPAERSRLGVTLLSWLDDPAPTLRIRALGVLDGLAELQLVPAAELTAALEPLLDGPDPELRGAAIQALAAAAASGPITPDVLLPRLGRLLADPTQLEPQATAVLMKTFGTLAQRSSNEAEALLVFLQPTLRHPDARVRMAALGALGAVAAHAATLPTDIAATLGPLLRDPDPAVRTAALQAFAQIPASPTWPLEARLSALQPLLADPEPAVRLDALFVLREQLLAHPDDDPRELIAALLPLLQDADPSVSQAARDSLYAPLAHPRSELAQLLPALRLITATNPDQNTQLSYELSFFAREAQPPFEPILAELASQLQAEDSNQAQAAANVMDGLSQNPALTLAEVEPLLSLISTSPHGALREQASWIIANQIATNPAQPELLPMLLALFQDAEPAVQIAAISTLSYLMREEQFAAPPLVEALLPLLAHNDQAVRDATITALGEAARLPEAPLSRIITALLPGIGDPNWDTVYLTESALERALTSQQPLPKTELEAVLRFATERRLIQSFQLRAGLTAALSRVCRSAEPVMLTRLIDQLTMTGLYLGENPLRQALVNCALEDPVQAQQLRAILNRQAYVASSEPLIRIATNRLLVMLDLVERVHATGLGAHEQALLHQHLEAIRTTRFFGDDLIYAAKAASTRLEGQTE